MSYKAIIEHLKTDNLSIEEIDSILNHIHLIQSRAFKRGTTSKARVFLKQNKHLDEASYPALARHLNMSERTLYRRLEKENTSFREILEEERKSRCRFCIKNGVLSGTEISEALGFSEPSYFYKFFKKWTGKSFREAKLLAINDREIGKILHT